MGRKGLREVIALSYLYFSAEPGEMFIGNRGPQASPVEIALNRHF